MLILYYLTLKKPLLLLLSYLLQAGSYFFLLKKLEINPLFAFLPNVAEYKMTRKVFPKRRTFFRPFILAAVLLGYAYYVNPYKGVGILYVIVAFLAYGLFLARLYGRLSKAFGKKKFFAFCAAILPPVFLTILGRGQAEYTAPEYPEPKPLAKWRVHFRRVAFVVLSVVELLVIIAGCGYFAIRQNIPGIIVRSELDEANEMVKDVTPTDYIVTREDLLGAELNAVIDENRSRDYFYPDHSNSKDTVVFFYIIGSNLEDEGGMASANLTQMVEATKQGPGLKFVIEAGGSNRWFTEKFSSKSYARYEIANGEITKIEVLPEDTCMSDWHVLEDFIVWAKENYNADRTMFLLWDHGGGVANGYGVDTLNESENSTISVAEIASAFEGGGMTFDFIGFDACLMQDIEVACALEPYADYFIASEEVEGGFGWFYTYPFGSLAKNPVISNEEFACRLIGCYDPYNTALHEGEVQDTSTLSVLDLTLVKSAYGKLESFFNSAVEKIKEDPRSFANFSLAAANTYDFSKTQIDLIGFLEKFNALDYEGTVYGNEEMTQLLQALKACLVCRNGVTVEGINGIAFALSYNSLINYDLASVQLEALSLDSEKYTFDVVFSIIAAQKMKAAGEVNLDAALSALTEGDVPTALLSLGLPYNYADSKWYIAGFEDYDDAVEFINIPLTETDDGYKVELPEKTWDIIADVQTMVYQLVEKDSNGAYRRYIGNDYLGGADENGNTLIAPDDCWVYINGQLVCYESDRVKITDEGEIYTGIVRAQLNGSENISIMIQWDDTAEGQPETAHVLGYVMTDAQEALNDKGIQEFVAGDSIRFLFDYYDAEGNFLETRPDGKKIRITAQERLEVVNTPMEHCTIEFGGLLTDVYQRLLTTEMITVEIG